MISIYLIPQPLSAPKPLSGIPEATTEENKFIFKQVQLYILATKRFAIATAYLITTMNNYKSCVNCMSSEVVNKPRDREMTSLTFVFTHYYFGP